MTFANELGINPDDYVELTSYTNYPFYQKVDLEVPDNWVHGDYYNLPLDEFMQVVDNAFDKGYSVCWDGDVSGKEFSWSDGVAIVPVQKLKEMEGLDCTRWTELTDAEKDSFIYSFDGTAKEKLITQKNRQQAFDNYSTLDDHLMHLTGIAKDQNGNKYYLTKNSWNVDWNPYNGF